MGLQLLHDQPNLLLNRFCLLQDLIVPKSKDAETSRLQLFGTIPVIDCSRYMLSSINLVNQFVFQADKI